MHTPFGLALFYNSALTVVTGLAVSDADAQPNPGVQPCQPAAIFPSGMTASG